MSFGNEMTSKSLRASLPHGSVALSGTHKIKSCPMWPPGQNEFDTPDISTA